MTEPVASLIIPSYRGVSKLPTLLEALRLQDAEFPWEALVVIDGATDESEALIGSFSDVPVRAIVLDRNRGRSVALNTGFAAAKGRVLIRCDDDLEPGADYVRLHVGVHDGPDAVGAIGLCRNVLPNTPYAEAYGRDVDRTFRDDAYATDPLSRWRYWAGNCSVTRATYDAVGPYDPDFREYGWEDVDWGYRMTRLGIRIELWPNLEVDHHAAATTTRVRVDRAFLSGRARSRFASKHPELVTSSSQPIPSTRVATKIWNTSVRGLSALLSRQRATALAQFVDSILPLLPGVLRKKVVALIVESAARAGAAQDQN